MRYISVCAILLFSFSSFALSPFYCTFVGDENNWYEELSWRGQANYNIQLGWNQTSIISKNVTRNGDFNEEFGMCSNITSTVPEFLKLNFYWVTGKQLTSVGDSCMYQGEQVLFETTSLKLEKENDFIYSVNTAVIREKLITFLNIVGVRPGPTDIDPIDTCLNILGQISSLPLSDEKASIKLDLFKQF